MASPQPRRVLELDLIAGLARQGVVVIAAGGGGIPMVLRADGSYGGVPAVIDKDLTSALLATELDADALLILTAVSRVSIHFRKPTQRDLESVTATELEELPTEGHFADGSMGPKVKAALRFSPPAASAPSSPTLTKRSRRMPAKPARMSFRVELRVEKPAAPRSPRCTPALPPYSPPSSAAAMSRRPPASRASVAERLGMGPLNAIVADFQSPPLEFKNSKSIPKQRGFGNPLPVAEDVSGTDPN